MTELKGVGNVKFSTKWSMPNRYTFSIPPINEFVKRWLKGKESIVDPFCGVSQFSNHSNDLAIEGGIDAEDFCLKLYQKGVRADAVIFDPPYSPRQISECYKSVGRVVTGKDTQNAALYARVKKPLTAILKDGGIALSFGWQSSGFTKKYFSTQEILLVQHGGAHNDTICVAQRYFAEGIK